MQLHSLHLCIEISFPQLLLAIVIGAVLNNYGLSALKLLKPCVGEMIAVQLLFEDPSVA